MTYIKEHERGLVYRRGDFHRYLKPGRWYLPPFSGYRVEILDAQKPFTTGRDLDLYLKNEELREDVKVLEVGDNELALRFVDNRFQDVYKSGKYAYWDDVVKQTFVKVDLSRPEIDASISRTILEKASPRSHAARHQVEAHQKALLYFDGVFQRVLEPGVYWFWKGAVNTAVQVVDMRLRQVDMTGQEVMTKDQVTLRLNFTVHYRIVDPFTVGARIKDYEQHLYIVSQLALRDYVGSLELEELLERKEDVGRFVLNRLKERSEELGTEFRHAGIKDIVLPGEIKDILNLVLTARKKAEANVITRREETASTRSLLNTARLMDENPTLYRLKELEFLERVSERVGSVSLMGGDGLLERLSGLLGRAPREGRRPP